MVNTKGKPQQRIRISTQLHDEVVSTQNRAFDSDMRRQQDAPTLRMRLSSGGGEGIGEGRLDSPSGRIPRERGP